MDPLLLVYVNRLSDLLFVLARHANHQAGSPEETLVRLRAEVREGLARHGLTPEPGDTPELLRLRLNDAYLVDVRRLRERQRGGVVPLRDYARHVEELRDAYPLLGLPLELWTE